MFATKKKLMTAVVMLVISAIMMTSASYAWFTISTNPEISNMTTQVVTNENLEIKLAYKDETIAQAIAAVPAEDDTNKQYTWGNIIDLSKTNYSNLSFTLRPSTISGGNVVYPNYGLDGRVDKLNALTIEPYGSDGFGNLEGIGSDAGIVYGQYVDFWLRSNITGDVTLSAATNRSTDGESGGGSVLTIDSSGISIDERTKLYKGVRIAFQDITDDTPENIVDGYASSGTITAASLVYEGKVIRLEANEPAKIRMYVYYDGALLYNSDALLGNSLVGAKLIIQFSMDEVTTSMDSYD